MIEKQCVELWTDLETLFGVADSDSESDSYSSSSSSSSGESDSEGTGDDGPKEVVLEGSAAQELPRG